MSRKIALLAVLALVGCGKKSEPASSGGDASKSGASANTDVPKDKASQEFLKILLDKPVHNFSPVDNAGMKFVYNTLTFAPDNTWKAVARMGDGDDSFDCKESGTWTMNAADTEVSAIMDWKLTDTTCAGRPKTGTLHVLAAYKGSDWAIQLR